MVQSTDQFVLYMPHTTRLNLIRRCMNIEQVAAIKCKIVKESCRRALEFPEIFCYCRYCSNSSSPIFFLLSLRSFNLSPSQRRILSWPATFVERNIPWDWSGLKWSHYSNMTIWQWTCASHTAAVTRPEIQVKCKRKETKKWRNKICSNTVKEREWDVCRECLSSFIPIDTQTRTEKKNESTQSCEMCTFDFVSTAFSWHNNFRSNAECRIFSVFFFVLLLHQLTWWFESIKCVISFGTHRMDVRNFQISAESVNQQLVLIDSYLVKSIHRFVIIIIAHSMLVADVIRRFSHTQFPPFSISNQFK